MREYLHYENCKCRKRLIGKLVKECSENIDEKEMVYSFTLDDYKKECNSCTTYRVLLVISFLIIIGISSKFICFHWYLKMSNVGVTDINPSTEATTD